MDITCHGSQDSLGGVEDAPESLGMLLARSRLASQLEQRDAARALGVRTAVIQALEEDAFDRIGASVFVRGYLTRYAQLLGLSAERVLRQYQQHLSDGEPPPLRLTHRLEYPAAARDSRFRWFAYGLIIVVLAWLGWLSAQRLLQRGDPSEPMASVEGTEAMQNDATDAMSSQGGGVMGDDPDGDNQIPSWDTPPGPPFAGAASTSSRGANPLSASEMGSGADDAVGSLAEKQTPGVSGSDVSPVALNAGGEVGVASVDLPAEAGASVEKSTDSAGVTKLPELVLQFSDDCWVDVKDADGKTLAYGVMKASTTQTLAGPAPFTLVLGNAPAVAIAINGEPIAKARYLPQRGTVSRFIVKAEASDD